MASSLVEMMKSLARAMDQAPDVVDMPAPEMRDLGVQNPEGLLLVGQLGELDWSGRSAFEIPVGTLPGGETKWLDIRKAPHVLVAGTTGSGKSVWMNTFLCSLLGRAGTSDIRLHLVDPKKVELSQYADHPYTKNYTEDVDGALSILAELRALSEERFGRLKKYGCKNMEELRKKTGIEFPYHVLVVDELADIMMLKSFPDKVTKDKAKEFEALSCMLAAKARASGIHLVYATQNPTAQIVTSLLKTNLPTQVLFRLDANAARLVLKAPEAAGLRGQGHLLYRGSDGSSCVAQGLYLSDEEVTSILG